MIYNIIFSGNKCYQYEITLVKFLEKDKTDFMDFVYHNLAQRKYTPGHLNITFNLDKFIEAKNIFNQWKKLKLWKRDYVTSYTITKIYPNWCELFNK